ncbi:hypothetical protein P3G55_23305 [Leptospira sp. 96542]|nr:hypothetical protein [Leptospira sp. 96542]
MFDELLRDTITLYKQDGKIIENIKASVQKNKIFIMRSDFIIEPMDLIKRFMSNGAEETFQVVDPGFHESLGDIPAGYQMEVKKLGIPDSKNAYQKITFNLNGINSRVIQNSVDNSYNSNISNPEIFKRLKELKELKTEIENLKLKPAEKQSYFDIVEAVEDQFKSKNPKKAVINSLLESLPNLGNLSSIGSFIISAVN